MPRKATEFEIDALNLPDIVSGTAKPAAAAAATTASIPFSAADCWANPRLWMREAVDRIELASKNLRLIGLVQMVLTMLNLVLLTFTTVRPDASQIVGNLMREFGNVSLHQSQESTTDFSDVGDSSLFEIANLTIRSSSSSEAVAAALRQISNLTILFNFDLDSWCPPEPQWSE